jgi:hypothetical protein
MEKRTFDRFSKRLFQNQPGFYEQGMEGGNFSPIIKTFLAKR